MYYLLDDRHYEDPVWDVLSAGKPAMLDAIQAAYLRMCSRSAHAKSDGYLTAEMVARSCRPAVLELLLRPVLERAPRLHKPGDECPCLGDTWRDGYAYRIHQFLRRNPSKAEHSLAVEKKKNLRDARLKHLVWMRDGKCCRYCGSGPLHPKSGRNKDRRKVLVFDHVDPDRAATDDGGNFVVACGRCNEHKGHRTPAEADMVLRPEPTEAERAALLARPQAVYDLPEAAADQQPDQRQISDESTTDHRSNQQPTTDPVADPDVDATVTENAQSAGQAHLSQPKQAPDQPQNAAGKGPGRDGAGTAAADSSAPTPTTPRSSAAPDIYTKRSRPAQPAQAQTNPIQSAPPGTPTDLRCGVCGDEIDPATYPTHPACDEAAGWPTGARPALPRPSNGEHS